MNITNSKTISTTALIIGEIGVARDDGIWIGKGEREVVGIRGKDEIDLKWRISWAFLALNLHEFKTIGGTENASDHLMGWKHIEQETERFQQC